MIVIDDHSLEVPTGSVTCNGSGGCGGYGCSLCFCFTDKQICPTFCGIDIDVFCLIQISPCVAVCVEPPR